MECRIFRLWRFNKNPIVLHAAQTIDRTNFEKHLPDGAEIWHAYTRGVDSTIDSMHPTSYIPGPELLAPEVT